MPDMPDPEILPPEPTGISLSRLTPVQKRIGVLLSGGALLGIFMWGISEFFSLRGVQHMLTSLVFLGVAWIAGVIIVFGIVRILGIDRWRLCTGIGALLLLFAAVFMHYSYPMPTTVTSSAASSLGGSLLSQPPIHLDSLTVSPVKLIFKDQAIGTTSTPQIIAVVNRTAAPRMITQIEASGDFSQTNDCAPELMVGDSCNVEVTFIPKTLGLTHGSLDILCHDLLSSSSTLFAKADFSGSGIPNTRSKSIPSKVPGTSTDKSPSPKVGLELKVSIVDPTDPAIVVDNQTDDILEGITWELVMFRTTDQAWFSYATQNIGYIKPHSQSARFGMQLNSLTQAPGGGGRIADGEHFVGTLAIDCPTCKGEQLIVSFAWGESGWFYQVPNGSAKLLWPGNASTGKIDLSKQAISRVIESINGYVKPEARIPIS